MSKGGRYTRRRLWSERERYKDDAMLVEKRAFVVVRRKRARALHTTYANDGCGGGGGSGGGAPAHANRIKRRP